MKIVSEISSSDPLVVIIAHKSDIAVRLADFFKSLQLQVALVSPDDDLSAIFSQLNKKNADIYKVIWLVGFSHQDFFKTNGSSQNYYHKLEKTSDVLKDLPFPVVTIAQISSQIKLVAGEIKSLKAQQQAESMIVETIINNLPQATKIFAQDIIDKSQQPMFPMRMFLIGANKHILLDLKTPVRFISLDEFFSVLCKQIIRPSQTTPILIRGEKQTHSFWGKKIGELYEKYFSKNLKPLSFPANDVSLIIPDAIVVSQPDYSILQTIDAQVRLFPKFSDELTSFDHINFNSEEIKTSAARTGSETTPQSQPAITKTAQQIINQQSLDEEDASWQNDQPADEALKKALDNSASNKPLSPAPTIEDELIKIFSDERKVQSEKRTQTKAKTTKVVKIKTKRKKVFFSAGLGVIFAGILSLILFSIFQTNTWLVKKQILSLLQLNSLADSQQEMQIGFNKSLGWQLKIYEKVFDDQVLSSANLVFQVGDLIEKIDISIKKSNSYLENILTKLVGDEQNISLKYEDYAQQMQESHQLVGQLSDLIDSSSQSKVFAENQGLLKEVKENLKDVQNQLAIYPHLSTLFENIIPQNQKRVYAVVLQNNLELRPTGGFIQAVALITVNEGRLTDYQVYDVYQLDEKLLSSVEPPAEIQQYLGEKKWFLHDANWEPDFSASSKRIAWFIKEITGRAVDGVVGINLSTLEAVLRETGELNLPNSDEVISATNLFERVEQQAGNQVADKSNTKSSFFAELFEAVITNLVDQDPSKLVKITNEFQLLLNHQEAQIELFDLSVNSILSDLKWNGEIVDPKCPSQFGQVNCEVSSIYQVESNIGLNVIGGYVHRKINHQLEIWPGFVEHTRTIQYQNTARSGSWPWGTYKSFVRFLLPINSVDADIYLNQRKLSPDKVSQTIYQNKRIVATVIEVENQKNLELEIKYKVNHPESTQFSYVFFDQKQPGFIHDELAVVASVNGELVPAVIAPNAIMGNNVFTFDSPRDTHFIFGILFQAND